MRRLIEGIVYDTAQAKVVASHQTGTVHSHKVSSVYRSPEGRYFLVEEREIHGIDGALLLPLSESMAREWLEKHGKADPADPPCKNGRIYLRIEIDSDLLRRIDVAAAASGLSDQEWLIGAINTALERNDVSSQAPNDEPRPNPQVA